MRIRSWVCHKVRGVPLWIIGLCGLAGVLVDADHLFSYWFTGQVSRAAHFPLLIVSCLVIGGIGACCGGLYFKLVLKRRLPIK
jgi:hypothetical protein